jgi:hypothetical protein
MARGHDRRVSRVVASCAAGRPRRLEVGEIRGDKSNSKKLLFPVGSRRNLAVLIPINDQEFTKTANCWGVENNAKAEYQSRRRFCK